MLQPPAIDVEQLNGRDFPGRWFRGGPGRSRSGPFHTSAAAKESLNYRNRPSSAIIDVLPHAVPLSETILRLPARNNFDRELREASQDLAISLRPDRQ